ncbi:MAG TPA: hypothetical protein VGS10_11430 [Terracidiphilus sp.]|nr:hypothetical protein [Terracidiphilus sp.]
MSVQPRFPIFVPTLSRADSRLTIKALQRMGIEQWYAVVEPQEHDLYAAVIPKDHIIVLDLEYKAKYDTLDNLGLTKSVGPGAARNFIWDTAIQMGHPWHWVMDDNIVYFTRMTANLRYEVLSGAFFRWMEDFVLRYDNIGMAGPCYEMFVPRKYKHPPLIFNTRIYSCNLIRNDIPYRWRGRYNEDTILSLDMLKDGWCTVQFPPFQQKKVATQTVKGGNDKVFYSVEGTAPKSQMLVDTYPEYARLVTKYGRVHHQVDYSPFRRNKLHRIEGVEIPAEPDMYGLELRKVS